MYSVNYHLPPLEPEDVPHPVGVENLRLRLSREMRLETRLVGYFPWLRYVTGR